MSETDYNSLKKRLQRLRAEANPQTHLMGKPDNHAFVEREDLAVVLAERDELAAIVRDLVSDGLETFLDAHSSMPGTGSAQFECTSCWVVDTSFEEFRHLESCPLLRARRWVTENPQ